MKKFRVYLCDLTYDTIILVSDTIPINIGFIGSYMKKIFGEKIDLSLFKYPNDVIQAIKNNPPDMICLSNYSWNSNLSENVASIAKKFNSDVVTVQGGTIFLTNQCYKKSSYRIDQILIFILFWKEKDRAQILFKEF